MKVRMVSEPFDPEYGRKTTTLGLDAPLSASGVRTSAPYSAIDPLESVLIALRPVLTRVPIKLLPASATST
ncbi:MAG: hypothetical protein NTW58_02785 [Actinobacteria bacterium]|nr:hypothetical protein [Actinomycetota bacterium]